MNIVAANELLRALAGTLGSLEEGAASIGQLLQAGKIQEGMTLLATLAEGLQEVFKASETLKQLGVDIEDFPGQMQPFLEDTNRAAANQDYVTISDVIRYEIVPLLGEWKAKVTAIKHLKQG